MATTQAPVDLAEAVRRDGIEFILAMFVDMHGKPCAKLVPASAVDGFVAGSAGFAGFAAGPMGQTPADPDLIAMPDPASYTPLPWKPEVAVVQCDPTVDGEPWPYAPRVILQRQLERLAERDLVLKVGAEAEYFLVRRDADGRHRGGRRARRLAAALLRRPGLAAHVRPPLDRVPPHQHPRLGQLRQRPRGRQRPVRAELPLRRRPDHRRPADPVPLHGARRGRRGRHAGDVHAQAVHPADRQRTAHPPEPVVGVRRRGAVRGPTTTRGASACRRWPTS